METMDRYCTKEGCTYIQDKVCLDGLSLEDCPNLKQANDEKSGDIEYKPKEEDDNIKKELIYDSEALTLENCNLVTAVNNTRIILLAGPTDSGKTTLVCALNYLFQKDSFGDFAFCNSYTLIGLERISHDSRSNSGRVKALTPRTPQDPYQRFYHFSVKKKQDDLDVQDILFTDVSGEHYKDLKNSIDECKQFTLIKRADHLVLFFDCEKLINADERHVARNDGLTLLRTLIDSGMVNKSSYLQVVFSKWDIVEQNKTDDDIKFIEAIKKEIEDKFKDALKDLSFHKIASRPDNNTLELGYGLAELLNKWVDESPFFKDIVENKRYFNKDSREFLKFGYL